MGRTYHNDGLPGFVVDWNSVDRNSGRQIDWEAVGATYRSTAFTVKANGAAAQSATSMTVDALPQAVKAGSILKFGTGEFAYVTANAAAGATSLSVEALVNGIEDNDEAIVAGNGDKSIPAGTIMAQLASGKLIPRASVTGAETATGILMATATERDGIGSGNLAYGCIIGGAFYQNLMPDFNHANFARLGWYESTKNIEDVAERLQDIGIAALSIHGRTRAHMYKGEADWSLIAAVKQNPRIHIPIFGNGDIDSPQKAKLWKEKFGVDGIMIGRASIGNPWIFNQIKQYIATGNVLAPPTIDERVNTCIQHLDFSLRWKGPVVGIFEMRRHYANYFKGLYNFKNIRMELVTTPCYDHIIEILHSVKKIYAHTNEEEKIISR